MQWLSGQAHPLINMGGFFYMSDTIHRGSKRNFFMVDNGVFDERLNLEPLDKLVYIALLRYADNNSREAFPAMQRIADDIGITRQRVNTAIKILEQRGLIKKKKRFDKTGGKKSNLYIVYDANEVINTMSTQITTHVNTVDNPCKHRLHDHVNTDYMNYTDLNILSEEEALHSKEEDKTEAITNIRHLKRLIIGTGGQPS
jgi:predicted transcriptional regulator